MTVRFLSFPLSLSLFISAWCVPLHAQIIQGWVVDRETGEGVEGALVLLLDQSEVEVDGLLTKGDGRFRFLAPNLGTYSLKAERLGYETVTSEVTLRRPGQGSGILLEMGPSAIELEELRVEGEQRCRVRPEEGLEVARVWEEARTALTVQEWTEGEDLFNFELIRYQRTLHPDSRGVRSEQREEMVVVNRNPIRSLPVQELMEKGFIQTGENGAPIYYGPDASVLLSDLFLDTHCFRLRTSDEYPELIGLAFEPVRRSDTPDILGTFWLDRATAELVRLDYNYDWARWEGVRGVAEGRVEFQQMPSGAWIVRKWWLRMPVLGQLRSARNSAWPSLSLIEIREVGSEVAGITTMDHQPVSHSDRRPRGYLRGMAWDSLRSRPLSGVTVFLSGTPHDASTDEEGHFFMSGVPEGDYSATLTHPSLASLGIYPRRSEVRINAGDTTDVRLGLPSKSSFFESVCGDAAGQEGDAFITGTVREGGGGNPTPGATVTLEWSREKANAAGAIIGRVSQGAQIVTNAIGRYAMCGIPPGSKVTARAWKGETEEGGPPREVEVERDGVVVLDLTLPPPGGDLIPFLPLK